ncbi:reverse transcriptase domain-containing protein [Tanacetum coccineum]|uniref:RNA helicase n=1 Tax=Tanacetum coccineum TaxID=301880 RepID=A0ABQ5HYE4_9ASTR
MATCGRKKSIVKLAPPPARDPRDVETIERLQQRIQELEFQQLLKDHHGRETKSESTTWDDGSEDVIHFGEGGNPRDEEEEYPFVNEYPSFKEEPIMLMEEESCPVYDTDNEDEEESMPVYDTDIDDIIEEEERFVGKGGFGEKEALLNSISRNQVIVVSGETGCGKTTQLPQYILESEIEAARGALCNIIGTRPDAIFSIQLLRWLLAE